MGGGLGLRSVARQVGRWYGGGFGDKTKGAETTTKVSSVVISRSRVEGSVLHVPFSRTFLRKCYPGFDRIIRYGLDRVNSRGFRPGSHRVPDRSIFVQGWPCGGTYVFAVPRGPTAVPSSEG